MRRRAWGAGFLSGGHCRLLRLGFALWGSVSEARATRAESSRDLLLLSLAATAGAAFTALLTPVLARAPWAGPELTLVSGAFLVGWLRRFGPTGAGIGSQVFIGELLAYGAKLDPAALPVIMLAGLIAVIAAIVPRMLSGPAEHPPLAAADPGPAAALHMGLQAGLAALVIVLLNRAVGLERSGWALAACTYVVAGTASATLERVRRRILGTFVGVPLALACLPLASAAPPLIWAGAALAMVVYAMALPERYDIACGAYAFALIVTLASGGENSVLFLLARAWETLLGGALGLATALLVLPLRAPRPAPD